VSEVSTGDRVALNGVLTCEECYWCRSGETTQCPDMAAVGFAIDGGLAERIVWRADRLVRLPDEVDSQEAALIEPTSVAIHAVRRSEVSDGDTVAIIGVGTVGMLAMQAAKARGAKVFAVDPRQMSLDLAAELGADATINPQTENLADRLNELTAGVGPDVVIDAAGTDDTTALSVNLVRRGGHVVLVAIYTSTPEFDFNSLVATEVRVSGSLAYQQRDVEEAVRLIADGKIKTRQLISDVITLDQVIDTGFQRMLAPTKDVFRILVSPNPR
jgi:(R,R)-butanediol dehydrogenase/meso-butanediol dehydrogenase/diacetyl reductase